MGPGIAPEITVSVASTPYPTVTGGPDPETVALLKEDYAGSISELTAVAQYIFQNISDIGNDAFSNAMLQIALVEMTHLDMIGDAIQALGGKASFDNGQYYWQAGKCNYADTMQGMLQADIESESGAISQYEKHASLTKNASVKALLHRIIMDEKLHLRFFNDTLKNLRAE